MSTIITTTTDHGTDVAVEVVYEARGDYAVLIHDEKVGTVRGTGDIIGDIAVLNDLLETIGFFAAPIHL